MRFLFLILRVLRDLAFFAAAALIVSACGGDTDAQRPDHGIRSPLAGTAALVEWFRDVTIESGIAADEFDLRGGYGSTWADFDGDGWLDIWVVNHMYEPSLYLNNRDGTFSDVTSSAWPYPKGDFHGAAWGDFDNDGDPDLAQMVGNQGGTTCIDKPFYVNVSGTLVDQAIPRNLNDRCGRGRTPSWLDWNNDGRLDLYLVNGQRPTDDLSPSRLMIQQPDGTFAELEQIQTQSNAMMGQLAWLDGALHVLTVADDEGIVAFHRVGNTTPRPVLMPDFEDGKLPPNVKDIAIGDFDGDLQDDLFILHAKPRGKSYSVGSDGRTLNVLVKDLGVERGVGWSAPASSAVRFRFYSTQWVTGDIRLGRSAAPAGVVRRVLDFYGERVPLDEVYVDPSDPNLAGISDSGSRARRGVYIGRAEDGRWQVYAIGSKNDTLQFDMLVDPGPISTPQSSGFEFRTDLSKKPNLLFFADGAFRERVNPWRMNLPLSCFSVAAGDFDNDMDLDLYMACSGPLEHVSNRLFENKGDHFEEVPGAGGGAVEHKADPGGKVSAADYNSDGKLDLLVSEGCEVCGPPMRFGHRILLKNMRSGNHWIEFDLVGCQSNRDGIGARVVVTAGGKQQLRVADGGMRDGVQSMKRIHVGLGPNTLAKRVKVKWPSGAVTEVADLQADRIHTLREDPTCSHDRSEESRNGDDGGAATGRQYLTRAK